MLVRFLAGAAVRRKLRDDAKVEHFRVEQVIWGGPGLLGAALLAVSGWWLTPEVNRREELLLGSSGRTRVAIPSAPTPPAAIAWRQARGPGGSGDPMP